MQYHPISDRTSMPDRIPIKTIRKLPIKVLQFPNAFVDFSVSTCSSGTGNTAIADFKAKISYV